MGLRSAIRRLALFLGALTVVSAVAFADNSTTLLDAGYEEMYNLQFDAAHKTFEQWQQQHPEDPMGPVSNAAAYLFAEFDRLHILQLELFTDDERFKDRAKPAPDPQLKQAFEAELAKARQLADTALQRNPQDANALFAKALSMGLRGDYLAMVEKRETQALSYMKEGRAVAERLLADNPAYYDAYLAIGVENYLLSLKSAPLRWILRIGGAETDKEKGLEKLRITAQNGRYLRSYARLLLAVAAVRDRDPFTATALLADLARRYPLNPLYGYELARMREKTGITPSR